MKQTLMLLDKSGLRKGCNKTSSGKKELKFKKGLGSKTGSTDLSKKRQQAIQMALDYGIGYKEYKKEVDAIRAERIRLKLEGK